MSFRATENASSVGNSQVAVLRERPFIQIAPFFLVDSISSADIRRIFMSFVSMICRDFVKADQRKGFPSNGNVPHI